MPVESPNSDNSAGPARWTIGEELGRGALGRVVIVSDRQTGDTLAGKILHESHRGDSGARQRFTTEARILGDLRHPNIVRVFGLESIGDQEVLLMERIDGVSLATLIAREAPMPLGRIVDLGRQLADGLAAAHHSGLIHRDLKPANVLVTGDGVAKIVDFGLARATSFEGVEAAAFTVVGTPDYMAPESIEPLSVDPRSDIYALGCILYEMAAGRPPYAGATAFALLAAHRDAPVPELPAGPDRPAELVSLVRWMMAKSPADRPQSAPLVADELARFAQATGGTSEALAVRGASVAASTALVAGGRCAACGQPLVSAVPICFGCAMEQPTLEAGPMSLFVTGPGDLASKLDSRRRQLLLDWLRANPSLGLDAAPLAQRLPRLPFVVAIGVSESSARRLARSLEGLGFETEAVKGGRFAHRNMRRKAWRLGGRVAAIVATSSAYMIFSIGAFMAPFLIALTAGALGSGWHLAGRRVARQGRALTGLPEPLAVRMERIAAVVPIISDRRHRDSLRAVTQRALALRDIQLERGIQPSDDELAELLDIALVAAQRLDELESSLALADLRDPDEALRARLRERDTWAARLLEAAAFLDSMRVRLVAATTDVTGEHSDVLDGLRDRVQALAEVQKL